MSILELIDELEKNDIELWLEGGKLRFRSPEGAMAPELRAALVENRDEVIDIVAHRARHKVEMHPTSYGQRALWFMHEMAPESPAYNVAFVIRIVSRLDVQKLETAFQVLIDRHASLRTVYSFVDGELVQEVRGYQESNLELHDVSALGAPEIQHEVERIYRIPFDLHDGPVFRTHLLSLDTTEHVLLITAHHIAMDAWSMLLMIEELQKLLEATGEDATNPLSPISTNYADFARWQREFVNGPGGERLRSYWLDQLKGVLLSLDLPTDHPRPAKQSFRGASEPLCISANTVSRLKALARKEKITMFILLLASFQAFLARTCRQEEVLVGSPVLGRSKPEFAEVLGDFINMVVFRGRVDSSSSFIELLAQTRHIALEAIDHQDYPFPRLVEDLNAGGDASRTPIFQAMFVLQTFERFRSILDLGVGVGGNSRYRFGDLEVEPYSMPQQEGQFDICLEMTEKNDMLHGQFKYNRDLFEPSTIKRMVNQFTVFLDGIMAAPETRIDELPLLSQDEREKLLHEWNATHVDYSQGLRLNDLITAQVERTPDATAVVFEGESLSYREFDERVVQLASYLQSLGVGAETLVAVFAERSIEMVVALHGIVRAGGAYVPVDPEYPEDRVSFMLEDSATTVLLTQSHLVGSLPNYEGRVVCLDTQWEEIVAGGDELVDAVDADGLAYVIYTSGSTGRPKGVMNEHRGICNRLLWMQETYDLTASDVVMQKTPFSFDVSVWEFFWPLMTGARLLVARPGGHGDPNYLVKLIDEGGVTVMHFVPSMLHAFLDTPGLAGHCKSLRHVMCSGEALDADAVQRFFQVIDAGLHNLYGPTEAAVDVTFWDCSESMGATTVPIGRPVANTQIYILDHNMEPTPIGVPGELHIGGDQVARGYLNREELTREKFIADPFAATVDSRLYKTGDLARIRADGVIEYLGRLDHQVKIRGFRIELGEIESILVEHDAVNSALVVAREMGVGDTRLVAYWVGDESADSAADLRVYLRERLPEYMVPQHFMALDSFPLSPNGKADRKALPEPELVSTGQGYVAPHTPTEWKVASIWQAVLGRERVGIRDSFFDIGGHSLLAATVVSRLREELGIELTLRQLFEAPSVAELARIIDTESGGEASQLPELVAFDDGKPAPLSYDQQRLWYLDQLEPNQAVYNMPMALRLSGDLDVDTLRRAINEIVRRHEALRTTLVSGEDGVPVQQVAGMLEFELPLESLDVSADEDTTSAARRSLEIASEKPFDLATGPLIRVRLLRLADREHLLFVVMHHAISDGRSLEIFLKEMSELYTTPGKTKSKPLTPLPVQYGDYARWQRDWLEGGELERQLEYWLEKFPTEPPVLDMPTDYSRPAVQVFRGAGIRFQLSPDLVASLERLGRAESATLFMVLLAAYKVLLSRYSGQDSITVGVPVANRPKPQLEPMIGMFVNTLVMNTDLAADSSFRETLKRVQSTCMDAYGHQDIPFERLVEAVNPTRDLSRTPLFQTLFSYQDMTAVSLEMGSVKVEQFDLPVKVSRTDLTLWLTRGPEDGQPDGIQAVLEYSTDLFDRQSMEDFIQHFLILLDGIATAPDTRIGELPLLSEDERERLVHGWNMTSADYQKEARLQDLIAGQVECTPDAIALEFEDERLSYRELDDRANEVANRLRALGIEPRSLIAVYLNRSADLVVALLGVFKLGCAYLPLDPEFPDRRVEFILEDASVACLITESTLRDRLPHCEVRLLLLDEAGESATGETAPGAAEDLAYVIYTSGSTGKPKGVQVTHGNVVNLLTNFATEPGFSTEDSMLAVTTPAFDISVLEIFLPLIVGGRLVVASSDDVTSADRLKGLLAGKDISMMQATPSTWRMLLDSGWSGAAQLKALCGGEALPQELASRIVERVGSLWNLYGPTETTIWSAAYRFESPTDPVYIGRPVANTQLYVLDRNAELCPPGVPGELYIGGAGVTQGYLNRPELTEERFVADPYSKKEGVRMYRTGDLVRYRMDGMLEYLQRLDYQVKIRGYRIELGEIETVLAEHVAVGGAVVIAQEISAGDTRLVAYWTGDEKSAVTGTGLRSFLRERLPGYMIPQHFVELDGFPLTPNGKVDRLALPGVFTPQTTNSYVEPRSPLEQRIASIWQAVLGTDRVGVHDNFFDIGGHSLLAVKVVERIKQELGAQVLLRNLVSDTLGQLALSLEGNVGEVAASGQDRVRKETASSRFASKFKFWNFRSWARIKRFLKSSAPDAK